jgi:hypothetical protein
MWRTSGHSSLGTGNTLHLDPYRSRPMSILRQTTLNATRPRQMQTYPRATDGVAVHLLAPIRVADEGSNPPLVSVPRRAPPPTQDGLLDARCEQAESGDIVRQTQSVICLTRLGALNRVSRIASEAPGRPKVNDRHCP